MLRDFQREENYQNRCQELTGKSCMNNVFAYIIQSQLHVQCEDILVLICK